jgi:2-polyprenyl-3-methyl-5-hydroxy-6-metoxy-1,4-benzoquinol methylase
MSIQADAIPAVIAEPQRPAELCWMMVERCPACGSDSCASRVMLPDRQYIFGAEQVPLPESGISVAACGNCGLVYKSVLPAPAFLANIFRRQAAIKWAATHDFAPELAVLQSLKGSGDFDLLDIGAAGGALLMACAANRIGGRHSALDVMRYPGIDEYLTGEFIEGFLDDASLSWSREPYEVVTLFDVLEHLYQPQIAFENLRMLVKQDGLVLIETGNVDNFWPARFGVNQWWYVRLLEHHIFWSRHSLEKIAAAHGFEIVFWNEQRHKSRRNIVLACAIGDFLKTCFYCMTGNYYSAVAQALGKQGNQPWYPFAQDHFQACLRKK